jgi:hypothetical protein
VIAVMGQPEDYIIEEDNHTNPLVVIQPENQKKLYRDKEIKA